MATTVREKPPLKLHTLIETPSGTKYRWGEDEKEAANTPSGLKFGDGMPGGYDSCDQVLPRKPGVEYGDLERLSTVTVMGAGGVIAWEGRLERAPRVSGDEMSVAPNCVGWQAHLEDDKSAQEIYVDRDMTHWGEPSMQRQANRRAAGDKYTGSIDTSPDTTTGAPGIVLSLNRVVSGVSLLVEAWYNGLGCPIASVYYDVLNYDNGTLNNMAAASWTVEAFLNQDDVGTGGSGTGDLLPNPDSGYHTPSGSGFKFASLEFRWPSTAATADGDWAVHWRRLAIWGTHGLTKQGTAPADGVFASDVIANAVSRWAPKLTYSTGANGTVKPSSFVIPHLEFREPTTAAEIVKQANRFHIRDWAVWDGGRPNRPTFYYHDRGDRGRSWRARVRPAQLEETGPQVDRLWNGVIVKYQDVDGTTRTVGPTGSSANTTSSDLTDTDTANPANKLGIRRWTMLDMNTTSTAAAATEVGRRFLIESKQLDRSGKATIVGYCEDDKGTQRPFWQLQAGDTIRFVDAADNSERRIVKTTKDYDNRTCEIDLDAPPEGMDALLERLGVVLVPLGL